MSAKLMNEAERNQRNNKEKLTICSFCGKEFREIKLCPPCKEQRNQSNEVHHGKKSSAWKMSTMFRRTANR